MFNEFDYSLISQLLHEKEYEEMTNRENILNIFNSEQDSSELHSIRVKRSYYE